MSFDDCLKIENDRLNGVDPADRASRFTIETKVNDTVHTAVAQRDTN